MKVSKPSLFVTALAAGLLAIGAGQAQVAKVATCPSGTSGCSVYTINAVKPIGCAPGYCGNERFTTYLDPSNPPLSTLRAQSATFVQTLGRVQGGPGTLYIFSTDAAFTRALTAGYVLNRFTVSGRTAELDLTFGR